MDMQDYITFANENPVCYMATADGDQPRVRAVQMWFADDLGFYFVIFSPKQVSKQLHENPKIEVSFYNNPPEFPQSKAMRITGVVEFLENQELIEKAYENRKPLENLVGKSIKEFIEVVRIKSGDVHFWTLPDVLKESQIEHVTF